MSTPCVAVYMYFGSPQDVGQVCGFESWTARMCSLGHHHAYSRHTSRWLRLIGEFHSHPRSVEKLKCTHDCWMIFDWLNLLSPVTSHKHLCLLKTRSCKPELDSIFHLRSAAVVAFERLHRKLVVAIQVVDSFILFGCSMYTEITYLL